MHTYKSYIHVTLLLKILAMSLMWDVSILKSKLSNALACLKLSRICIWIRHHCKPLLKFLPTGLLLLWIFSIPSLVGPAWCAWSTWQKWTAIGFLFSGFLCRSSVHSSWGVGHSLSLQHTSGRTSCMICRFIVLHEMMLLIWYYECVVSRPDPPSTLQEESGVWWI